MKRNLFTALILSFCFCLNSYSQSTVQESLKFPSKILGEDMHYSIYLPDGYNTSSRNYPVLYLLHGYSGDETNWLQSGEMQRIADKAIGDGDATEMIIVMPRARNSYYINQYDGKVPYEDMFFKELIPYIDKTYRTRPEKNFRAIAGLSMGGYGAFYYSLHQPECFSACVPISAAVFQDDTIEMRRNDPEYKELYARLYGTDGLEYWHKHNVFNILSNLSDDKLPKVRYYIDCGDDDFLLECNFQLHKLMQKRGIKHEFRVRDGGHTWEYWRTALPDVLKFVSQPFRYN